MVRALVVDMQYGFLNEYTEHLVNKIEKFINRMDFEYVIGTAYVNHENTACYKFEDWVKCMRGSDEAEIVDAIADKVGVIFEKDKYSCWGGRFKEFIEYEGIEQIYFCGVNTGCCVLHSAFDAYNDVYDCYVIEDLCGSTSGESSHKAAIQVLKECITEQRVIMSSSCLSS